MAEGANFLCSPGYRSLTNTVSEKAWFFRIFHFPPFSTHQTNQDFIMLQN